MLNRKSYTTSPRWSNIEFSISLPLGIIYIISLVYGWDLSILNVCIISFFFFFDKLIMICRILLRLHFLYSVQRFSALKEINSFSL